MKWRSTVTCDGCGARLVVTGGLTRAEVRKMGVTEAHAKGWAADIVTGAAKCPACKKPDGEP